MAEFRAPPAGTIQRAPPTNPIAAMVNSVIGVGIGILLILLVAPTVLWFAESQNAAKVFSFSREVAPTSGASGFIRTMDMASADTPISCYQKIIEGDCLYYSYKQEELQYIAKDHCGAIKSNQRVIEQKGQKCYRDSNDDEVCEQCYLVNESEWNVIIRERKFQAFTIGNFKVSTPGDARIIGAEEYYKEIDATHKESMSYIKDKKVLLVAGSSDGTIISHGGSKKYLLISSMEYQPTYDALKAHDIMMSWILRLVAFAILLTGYGMIFGPISVMSNFVRKIPFLGRWIDNAVGGIIFLVSLLLAAIHFVVLWILIIILKNILLIAIAAAAGVGIFYLYTRFKKSN